MSGIEAAFFGTLGRDCENKLSKGGKSYLRLNMRVGDGDAAQWVSVMAFDPRAIEQADKFVKGARCYVEGRLSADEWTNADGVKRFGLSVMSWHCRLSEIGRNKPVRKNGDAKPRLQEKPASANAFLRRQDSGRPGDSLMSQTAHASPDPLDLLFERCCTLADRVFAGELGFIDAVDMAWEAAEFAGIVGRVGPDQVQAVLAAAFVGARR